MFAIVLHGYHVGVEDQEVYLAAIHKNLDPAAYPFNAHFFTEQTKIDLFVPAVAETARLLHSLPWALLLWHATSLFLVLLGCWQLSACFADERVRWAGVLLVAVLLTLPIAGTALYPFDQYLHPRGPATAGILMALGAEMQRRWLRTVAWLIFAVLMHPLMAIFGASLAIFIAWPTERSRVMVPALASLSPLQLLQQPSDAWKNAAQARSYYFPLRWAWYEWLGLVAPVLLIWGFAEFARRRRMAALERITTRLVAFSIFQFAIAAVLTVPAATERFAALQPMRWLHLTYFLFVLIGGCLIGELVLQRKLWRWLVLFVPLAATMFFVQRELFNNSDHIEWPGRSPKNLWASAFLWSRDNTPGSAIFAIDPNYMSLPEEDGYGFRSIAVRSLLAEDQKDPGAATVFPEFASEWQDQVRAQAGIESFNREQFAQLRLRYNVSWTVLPASATPPLDCPYRNQAAQVCRVE